MKEITIKKLKTELSYFGETLYESLISYEKADRPTITEKECEVYFVEWWNNWTKECKTELDINWPDKRASHILLQLAFIELKKKEEI